jgi:hypothetical protein
MMSAEDFRIQANEIYKTCDDMLPVRILKEKIFQAIKLYEKGINVSDQKLEVFKCNKNIALAYQKLWERLNSPLPSEKKLFEEWYFYGFNCLESYGKSLKFYKLFLTEPDQENFIQKIVSLYQNIWNFIIDCEFLNEEEKLKNIRKLENTISWEFACEINVEISCLTAGTYLHKGIFLYDKQEYIQAISMLSECMMYVKRALSYERSITNYNLIEALLELQESVNYEMIRSNTQKAIAQAEKFFNSGVLESESLDMEFIYLSLDKYREALLQTKCFDEKAQPDIELEAIIYSKLGYIFFHILKNETKAEINVKQSVDLGVSLFPKNVSTEKWYREATNILREIRQKKIDQEDKNMQEYKQKFKDGLAETFKTIELESKKSTQDFLKFIIANYPPQEEFTFNVTEEILKSGLKDVLKKLITKYHPDKFPDSDMKKKVLMEEICKYLNQKYDYLKQ